jgi:hypothetical protein
VANLSLDEQVERLMSNLTEFLGKLGATPARAAGRTGG